MTRSVLGLALCACIIGCTGGSSGRGESCRARNDCANGLACVNMVCTLNDFEVSTTAMSCDLIECTADPECCPEPSSFCQTLEAQCRAGDAIACSDFDDNCVCNNVCQENRCVFQCTDNFQCPSGMCVAGSCVECMTNDDCFGDDICNAGACVTGCSSSRDCPYLHTCTAGQCVETGCTTDRECIALTDNPRSICREAVCTTPCSNDAECNGGEYRFQACIDSQCTYVGCETDEECRIYLNIPIGSDFSAVCRM
jgi:hypothetical protein